MRVGLEFVRAFVSLVSLLFCNLLLDPVKCMLCCCLHWVIEHVGQTRNKSQARHRRAPHLETRVLDISKGPFRLPYRGVNGKCWEGPLNISARVHVLTTDGTHIDAMDWKVALWTATMLILVGSEKLAASSALGPRR